MSNDVADIHLFVQVLLAFYEKQTVSSRWVLSKSASVIDYSETQMLLNHIHGLVVEVCLVCKAKHFFHRLFDQVSRLFQLVLLLPIVLENVLDVWIVNFISVVIIN